MNVGMKGLNYLPVLIEKLKTTQPEKIILFGSYAYGKPTPWSDVDLLIIMETPKGELETSLDIIDSLSPTMF